MITEKIYSYPADPQKQHSQGSLLVWRNASETGETALHLFGDVAETLNFWYCLELKKPPADLLALRTLQWASDVSECRRIVLHPGAPSAYTTPAGVQLLENTELAEPQPLVGGERIKLDLTIDTHFRNVVPDLLPGDPPGDPDAPENPRPNENRVKSYHFDGIIPLPGESPGQPAAGDAR